MKVEYVLANMMLMSQIKVCGCLNAPWVVTSKTATGN